MQKSKIKQGYLTILLYHGVTNAASKGIENYSGKHCSRQEFIGQMNFLKDNCEILSMDEVVWHYRNKKPLPKNSVTVTFDDGFKNNFTIAIPILNDLKIPAVFYISAGFIGTARMFWVDILEDCINRCKKNSIKIAMFGRLKEFSLASIPLRILALETIKNYCKKVPGDEKDRLVDSLRQATGVRPSVKAAANYLKMSWPDLAQIKDNKLFTIGAHSLNHTILSALAPDLMREEVSQSLNLLNSKLGLKIRHYSYPEGQKNHYNNDVIDYLKAVSIVCCPTAIDGINTLKDDLFHLKRIMVGFKGRPFPFKDLYKGRFQK